MDAYAVLRVKTKKTELVYTGESLSLEPRKHSLCDAIELLPEERLALFRLILEVQEKGQNSLKWTVKELVDVCDSNVASIRSLIRKLKGCGLIEPDIVKPTTHGGRTSFIVTTDCRHLLEQSAWLEEHPIRALQRRVLLPEEGYNPEKKKRGGFSRSNRWLLAVLLEHSDLMGIVDELGGVELRSLSGFTKERLRVQLRQLNALGFLLTVVPGISGHPFLRIKPSVYYLNLHHPYFGSSRFSGKTILIRFCSAEKSNTRIDIDQLNMICTSAVRASTQPLSELESVRKLWFRHKPFFMGKTKSSHLQFIESLLGRLASFILDELIQDVALKHVIKRDVAALFDRLIFNPKTLPLSDSDKERRQVEKDVFIDLALLRAQEMKKVMIDYSDLPLDKLRKYEYLLLPVGYHEGAPRFTFAVQAYLKNKKNQGDFKCLAIWEGSHPSSVETNELTAEQRHDFGFIDKQMLQKIKALDMPVFDGSSSSDSPET